VVAGQHELTNTSVRVPEKHSVRVLISEIFREFKTRAEHMPSLYSTNDISKSQNPLRIDLYYLLVTFQLSLSMKGNSTWDIL